MKENKVYVIQEIAGTAEGRPKINIMGASKYGEFVFLLPELEQRSTATLDPHAARIWSLIKSMDQLN